MSVSLFGVRAAATGGADVYARCNIFGDCASGGSAIGENGCGVRCRRFGGKGCRLGDSLDTHANGVCACAASKYQGTLRPTVGTGCIMLVTLSVPPPAVMANVTGTPANATLFPYPAPQQQMAARVLHRACSCCVVARYFHRCRRGSVVKVYINTPRLQHRECGYRWRDNSTDFPEHQSRCLLLILYLPLMVREPDIAVFSKI